MTKNIGVYILIAIITSFLSINMISHAQEAKSISVEELCESNMDEPMGGDSLYKEKLVRTTIKPNMTRKIHSLCSDAPEGTFTVEFVTKRERLVQCFCNAPDQNSILETPKGESINIQGTFKSLTASFFESESKQCTITLQGCTFN